MNKLLFRVFLNRILVLRAKFKTNTSKKASYANRYRIVGYIYGSPSRVIDATKLTHINYAFVSINSNHSINVSNTLDLKTLVKLKLKNPNLKVILSVGGWGMDGFSQAASTKAGRNAFAKSCLNYVKQYGLVCT